MNAIVADCPCQGLRAVIDVVRKPVEYLVQSLRLIRFRAVKGRIGASKILRLAAIDLAAAAISLIDDDGAEPRPHQRLGGTRTGGAGAHDHDAQIGHNPSGTSVLISMPGSTAVEQARSRSPSPVQTQQS